MDVEGPKEARSLGALSWINTALRPLVFNGLGKSLPDFLFNLLTLNLHFVLLTINLMIVLTSTRHKHVNVVVT